jgi:hypothetical protein
VALKRCEGMIGWYDRSRNRARLWYRGFQTAIIVLTGITPLLILWGPDALPRGVQAIPPAIAALCAALVAAYHWREDWVRYTVTAELLRSEQYKYRTRTTPQYAIGLPELVALDNFMRRIEAVAASEVADWRNQNAAMRSSGEVEQPGGAGRANGKTAVPVAERRAARASLCCPA